jgi:hypothetical protein
LSYCEVLEGSWEDSSLSQPSPEMYSVVFRLVLLGVVGSFAIMYVMSIYGSIDLQILSVVGYGSLGLIHLSKCGIVSVNWGVVTLVLWVLFSELYLHPLGICISLVLVLWSLVSFF